MLVSVSIFMQDFPEFPPPPADDEQVSNDNVSNIVPDQVAQATIPTAKNLNPFKQDYSNFDDQANIGKISDILEDAFATPQLESLNPLWGNDTLKPQMMMESDVTQKIVDEKQSTMQDVGHAPSPKMVISILFFVVVVLVLNNNIRFVPFPNTCSLFYENILLIKHIFRPRFQFIFMYVVHAYVYYISHSMCQVDEIDINN